MDSPGDKFANRSLGQVYALFLATLLALVAVTSPLQLWSPLIAIAVGQVVLILAALLFVRLKGVPLLESLEWRPVGAGTIVRSMLLGISGFGIAGLLVLFTQWVIGEHPAGRVRVLPLDSYEQLMLTCAVAAILPGICEETLFRGVLLAALLRMGRVRALVVSSFLFAVFHVDPWRFAAVFFLGFVLGILPLRTGSIIPAMVAHTACNTTAFTVSFLFRDSTSEAAIAWLAMLSVLFLPIAWEFLRSTRHHASWHPALANVPAGLQSRWWRYVAAGGLAVLLLVLVPALLLVSVHTMASDALQPDILKGDIVFLRKTTFLPTRIRPNTIVAFERDGRLLFRRAVKVEGDNVWIQETDSEEMTEITKKAILGRVVHTVRPR